MLIVVSPSLHALDLTVIGGAGNFSFDLSSEEPIGSGEFKGKIYPLGRITVKDSINETFGYTATAERDPVLRNIISCEMTINAGYFNFSIGPLLSLFNSRDDFIRPGISASLGVEFPGILFITVGGGGTLGSIPENDHTLERGRIALGVWLPNVLSTLSLTGSKFIEADTVTTEDALFRVCYRADVYAKNVPFTVSVEMGYQNLKRTYRDSAQDGEDSIREVFLGFETNISITPKLILIVGAETPVFVWGKSPLTKAKGIWYFRAFTGITWIFDNSKV